MPRLSSKRVWALVVVAFAVLSLQLFGCGHSSDADLVRNLQDHRSQFDRLVALFQTAGGLQYVDTRTAYWRGPGVPHTKAERQRRVSECRRLLRELGLSNGIERRFGATWITTSTVGLAVSGSAKGYVYADRPPGELVKGLDNYHSHEVGGDVFRHVEGKWYLYYSWET
jgi:hypothetical protein